MIFNENNFKQNKNLAVRMIYHYLLAILIVSLAAALRIWPLEILGLRAPWLTFYPAVMLISFYGGFSVGIFGSVLSCYLVMYQWNIIVDKPFIKDYADWLGMFVYFVNCILISILSETSNRAKKRAKLAQEEAETANKAKSLFLANMSHELRTPLNAILGFSNLLRNSSDVTQKQLETLEIINRSGEHLLNLINNILDISKIESGKVTLNMEKTNIIQLIHEQYSLLNVKASSKNLNFKLDISPDFPEFIIIDSGKIKQVLINIIGNAIKFTQIGEIVLRALVIKKYNSTSFRIRFEIIDTGSGIDDEGQKIIFGSFVQIKNSNVNEIGTGLGLAISKQIIELMGGKIGVKSQIGFGSTFYIEFDVNVEESTEFDSIIKKNKISGFANAQPNIKILITDDNSDNRLLLMQLLQPLGFDLLEACNGKEAVDISKEWNPQLILMDIRMPILDGYQATKIIKNNALCKNIKIIAVTAHAFDDEKNEILSGQFDGFVRKPFKDYEIFEILKLHLNLEFIFETNTTFTGKHQKHLKDSEEIQSNLDLLPKILLHELKSAVELLDKELCFISIEKINKLNPQLANNIYILVDKMEFSYILYLIDRIILKEII